ncbi:hypothetical protein CKL83_14870 [Bacillus anthracis]|uniref:Uncharacterized protein n=8 Tax=Bacillus cereus group TaxID=86661 RepID=A0A2B6CD74_BACAN|nr:hypothetical protein BA_2934 [Bacillus anthracis str. Ames]AAT35356.1 hypothetical protein GBAA_2934 [Bacillus anthracis str. 'Ames Ancestor']ACK91482.1 hypothetical protein BCAH820_2933 [Bacillus cereus AH820]ACO28845.1 hypothetical protein BCA_3006 [Bacillus cereus 03BB102]ACP16989.1 hypothetical protein BAMEG_1670 [Bacillus anthracis str. CDC 684]APT26357.1 hypothetical protein BVB96_15020 [Bacillus anthracis]ARZ63005.1 hypothetical protein B7P25_14800 [Bacillus thuringiensis]EDR20721.
MKDFIVTWKRSNENIHIEYGLKKVIITLYNIGIWKNIDKRRWVYNT